MPAFGYHDLVAMKYNIASDRVPIPLSRPACPQSHAAPAKQQGSTEAMCRFSLGRSNRRKPVVDWTSRILLPPQSFPPSFVRPDLEGYILLIRVDVIGTAAVLRAGLGRRTVRGVSAGAPRHGAWSGRLALVRTACCKCVLVGLHRTVKGLFANQYGRNLPEQTRLRVRPFPQMSPSSRRVPPLEAPAAHHPGPSVGVEVEASLAPNTHGRRWAKDSPPRSDPSSDYRRPR